MEGKINEIISYILKTDGEIKKEEFKQKFKISPDEYYDMMQRLEEGGIAFSVSDDTYIISDKARIFKSKVEQELLEILKLIIKSNENIKSDESNIFSWDDLINIKKFIIFDGAEKIYEIHIQDKIVRLEGKEIMDYNIFRLRVFEQFGIMLETYKGIGKDWSNLVSRWYKEHGEYSKEKIETISDGEEAVEIIVDYVNNATLSDNHILKEGIICLKDGCIYLATKIVKKLLKRNNLNVSLRKLSYLLNNYLMSGSMPIKIENKSERFWKLYASKFELKNSKTLEITEVEDE